MTDVNESSQRASTGTGETVSILFSLPNTSMNPNSNGGFSAGLAPKKDEEDAEPLPLPSLKEEKKSVVSPVYHVNSDKQAERDARRRMNNRERVRKCRKRKKDRLAMENNLAGSTPKGDQEDAEPLPLPSPKEEKKSVMPPVYHVNVGHHDNRGSSPYNQEETDARRRVKNRERVQKCRKLKKDRLSNLESRTSELGMENDLVGLTSKTEVDAEPPKKHDTVVPPVYSVSVGHHDDNGGAGQYKQSETDARRRVKNRARVSKCRKRKEDRLSYLEVRNSELEGRNSELEMENDQLRVKVSSTGELNNDNEMNTSVKEAMVISQDNTVDRLKTAINNGLGTVEEVAQNIWAHDASMVHGVNGARSIGFNEIIKHFEAMSHVFSSYRIKNVSVARQEKSCSKAVATWDIELVLFAKPTKAARSTGPFHQLAPHLAGDKIRFNATSYLSFEGDKIVEEVQVVDSLALLSGILTKNRKLGPLVISSITHSIVISNNAN